MDIYQLAMNGKADALIGALDAEPSVLQRPQKGGLYDSRTLLHCAAGKGHEAVVRLLLERGADASAADKRGQTAADLAQKGGHAAVVILLQQPTAAPAAVPNPQPASTPAVPAPAAASWGRLPRPFAPGLDGPD